MFQILIQTFLGWPAMLAAIGLALAGILFKKSKLTGMGAVLFMGPAWYLAHYTILFYTLPLMFLLSAYLTSKGRATLAFLSILPIVLFLGWLGYVVLTQ